MWKRVLKHLESRINPHQYAAWFYPTTFISEKGNTLVVGVPSRGHGNKLKSDYGETVTACMLQLDLFYEIEYREINPENGA